MKINKTISFCVSLDLHLRLINTAIVKRYGAFALYHVYHPFSKNAGYRVPPIVYHPFSVYHRSCTTPFSVYHRSCTTPFSVYHRSCTTPFSVYHRSCTTPFSVYHRAKRKENFEGFQGQIDVFGTFSARSAKKILRVFKGKLMFLVPRAKREENFEDFQG